MLKTRLLAAGAALALAVGAAGAIAVAHAQPTAPAAKPTPEDAKAFVDRTEAQMAALSQYVNKASWVRATYITEDTPWREPRGGGAFRALPPRAPPGGPK